MRLIALWHQNLMRSEKSRGWTLFSNSNRWPRKKKLHRREGAINGMRDGIYKVVFRSRGTAGKEIAMISNRDFKGIVR
jgi:hypothetical protein